MKKKSLLNFLSKTGYKRNSPHVRRPMNLIPSGKITMKGVDFPVKGIDNLGNEQMMYPGLDYTFPGDYVLELPMMQPGRSTFNIKRVGKRKDEKNYIDSVLNANKNLDWVQRLYEKNPQSIQIPGKRGRATHYMESADNRVYPTVVRRLPNSNLEYLGNNAYDYADSTKSFIQFPSDEEAQWFAKNYKKGTAVLPKKQLAGETSSTKPYLPVMSNNGWLDEVLVTPGPNFRGEYPAFPYYNQLTSQDREFFHNDDGPIGRSVRMRAITGKVGQTYNDLRNIALRAEKFVGENTGILGAARFLNQPIKKLKGAGRTLEATILGSSPFITSPYNEEDVADFFDTMDAFGIASSAVAPLKTPLQQGIKSSGRYLARGYGNLSTGNSFIPRAWRSPIKNIDQPMSQKFFDETIDVSKLSKEDKKLWAKYQKDSGPYKIPGTKEYDEMQDLISRSSIAFPEGMPLTRMIGFENMTSPINKSGILDVSSPTSFSTGRGQEIIGNIAGEGNRRVVIPPKYAKKLEGYFGKNPYAESLDQPLDLLRQEKEVVGSGFKLKQIGKVKNELGGYDYIMKPINLSKPKQLPGSRTSNSIMRDSKGQIQFLDNETYQDALKTGILNVRDYILDPRYRNVVEANQQLANRLNMNRVLPIQKEMGNVGLYDARVAKVNQPLYIQDPRPLETKIIQGTNDGVQAQYSRNLDGSGYLTIPRLHDKAKIIKNVEHEALHHVYPNLGEGFPSFTPLETAKAKAVFKSSAELRKIEQANKIPLWYLDDVDELVPNSFDLAKDLGIKRFQMYPGKERFKQILDSYQGNKKFIKDALKLNTSRDYKRAWDMLSGVRVGYAGAAYLGYEGLQGQQSQVPQQKDGGTLPKAQLGEFFLPKSYMTFPDATYTVYADRARENQKAREYLDQKEKDYQAVKRDMTGTLEEKFRKKYGTSPHRYKYDTDPVYRVQTQQAAEEQSRLQGEIKLPHTNMFSEDYTGNPNLRFMNPNRFTGEQARFNEEFTTGVMSAMTPIPVLQSVGRLPSALKLAANTGQFLTTKTPLKDAYKINPWVFKPNSEAYYRVLGKEGLNDALESGVIRANPKNIHPFSGEPIYDRPYFSKGVPFDRDWKSPFKNKKGKQVVGSIYPDETMVEVLGHNKFHKTGDLVTSPIGVLNSFDKGINFYKRDWLRGYKEVPKPKTLPGSANSKFQSEIDWSKWNPETPKYPELIDEYNAIEESTKKAGTWMKNADGSAFKGTPEQFIQQQSSHFRKAFPNPVRERRPDFFSDEILGGQDPKNYFDENMPVQFNYHSSPNEFDFFDENLFSLGAFGKGIYTTRLPQNMYGKNQYQLYLNANNPQPYSYTRFVTKNGSEVAERVNAPKLVHEKTFYQQLEPGRDYFNPAEESSQSVVPFSNYPKSAIGNVGFFDMTNPNIYKSMMLLGAIYGGRNYYRDK
jgi:hypothetical protein